MNDMTQPKINTTYCKVLINNWPLIQEIIQDTATLTKIRLSQSETPEPAAFSLALLTDQQLNDSWHGPLHQFLAIKLRAYAVINLVRAALLTQEDETFKPSLPIFQGTDKDNPNIPKTVLETMNLSDLKDLQSQLEAITVTHYNTLCDHIQTWCTTLIDALADTPARLSESEADHLMAPEPLSELLERFTELNIENPKLRNDRINFADYFTLKCDLAIQSSLARQHLENSPNEIRKILKALRPQFSEINKQEKLFIKTVAEETTQVMDPLSAVQC